MLAAVEFDDQPLLKANEVGEERTERELTAEFELGESAGFGACPKKRSVSLRSLRSLLARLRG